MDITSFISTTLVLLVAGLHLWFWVLEMFLWQKPRGLKTFRMTPDQARATATLAANQGLYNALFASGLLCALTTANTPALLFLLAALIVAGLYGAKTVHRKIFFVQSLPAIFALLSLLI